MTQEDIYTGKVYDIKFALASMRGLVFFQYKEENEIFIRNYFINLDYKEHAKVDWFYNDRFLQLSNNQSHDLIVDIKPPLTRREPKIGEIWNIENSEFNLLILAKDDAYFYGLKIRNNHKSDFYMGSVIKRDLLYLSDDQSHDFVLSEMP